MLECIQKINRAILENKELIEEWFHIHRVSDDKLLYSSMDIRYSGFKMAPVDFNLFPAGFNNLSPLSQEKTVDILRYNGIQNKNIVIIVENFSKNLKYFDSIKVLQDILIQVGNQVKIATLGDVQYTGDLFDISVLQEKGGALCVHDNFYPEYIILNADLSEGLSEILLKYSNNIQPSIYFGWFNRSKYEYFMIYNQLVRDLCQRISIDPWLLTTSLDVVENVSYKDKRNLDLLSEKISKMLKYINSKYQEYDIKETPYVVVKSDRGTYGMSVIDIYNEKDILNVNKRIRKKLHINKGGSIVDRVMIQEGITTCDKYEGFPAESLIYSIKEEVVAYLVRYNSIKNKHNNLNSRGAVFADTSHSIDEVRRNVYRFINRLASLASHKEPLQGKT
ncbi:MAG: glutamate-cysteine ligase family protein [Candidatus Xenolissoclinum pacificiensis L6]|uniref:Glutamate-cysteine ligase family protein n=1 Tax=Candidatus Xenolissoclinum pacificiensis L6 TaxID=1401685 RepID=W2V0Q5_9RICK|nr:MAG: glutamate-cysteine ligase family protein [Candidatus Xenolissoclinum pacificiensis L6]